MIHSITTLATRSLSTVFVCLFGWLQQTCTSQWHHDGVNGEREQIGEALSMVKEKICSVCFWFRFWCWLSRVKGGSRIEKKEIKGANCTVAVMCLCTWIGVYQCVVSWVLCCDIVVVPGVTQIHNDTSRLAICDLQLATCDVRGCYDCFHMSNIVTMKLIWWCCRDNIVFEGQECFCSNQESKDEVW